MHAKATAAAAAVAVPNASSISLGATNCVNGGGFRGGVALAGGSAWTPGADGSQKRASHQRATALPER